MKKGKKEKKSVAYKRGHSTAFANALVRGVIERKVDESQFVYIQWDYEDNPVFGLEAGKWFLKRWFESNFAGMINAPAISAMLRPLFPLAREVGALLGG